MRLSLIGDWPGKTSIDIERCVSFCGLRPLIDASCGRRRRRRQRCHFSTGLFFWDFSLPFPGFFVRINETNQQLQSNPRQWRPAISRMTGVGG